MIWMVGWSTFQYLLFELGRWGSMERDVADHRLLQQTLLALDSTSEVQQEVCLCNQMLPALSF